MSKFELAMMLIELTGAKAAMLQQMTATMDQMRKLFSESPLALLTPSKQDLDQFIAKAEKGAPEMIHNIAALYAERFTEEELKGLVEFYSSPVGRSSMAKLPSIMEGAQVMASAWAKKLTGDLPEAFMH